MGWSDAGGRQGGGTRGSWDKGKYSPRASLVSLRLRTKISPQTYPSSENTISYGILGTFFRVSTARKPLQGDNVFFFIYFVTQVYVLFFFKITVGYNAINYSCGFMEHFNRATAMRGSQARTAIITPTKFIGLPCIDISLLRETHTHTIDKDE